MINDLIYIIGDNSPYLFILDRQYHIISKFRLFNTPFGEDIIAKPVKPDLESLTSLQWKGKLYLLALGSGSLKPYRDFAFLVETENHSVKKISLSAWYGAFRNFLADKKGGELNLEGAVCFQEKLFLFQRGNITGKNFIFSIPAACIFQDEPQKRLSFETRLVALPTSDRYHFGFSGACLSDDAGDVIFSCTIENTLNVYDDGDIIESRIGKLNLTASGEVPQTAILQQNGKSLITKLESVGLLKKEKGNLLLAGVCDNDATGSELIEMKVSL